MKVKQISVFLENKNGRLAEVTRILSEGNISLRALTIADTADFGILRIISEQPDKTLELLKEHNLTARVTEVIGVRLGDKPGALHEVMEVFEKNKVNIEYLYSTLMVQDDQVVIMFKVEDIDYGLEIIKNNGMEAITAF
ncbi:MAG: amino acid-binding protein [Spirochaetaceae bacterium 4572_59]|nr:MAG: amino acid-binding protein [Spirochaetaceae bacterium 4572_59]